MTRQDRGGWSAVGFPRKSGLEYGFIVDGEGPFPDPRSAWQPNGVHGLSRVVDYLAFAWTDSRWRPPPIASAIIYELYIGAFIPAGTFDAAIRRLDYMADLGGTHLELMPIAEFEGCRGWGYDGVGLFAPHHAYGGRAGLQRFVDACHARGLAVILDIVDNHLGPSGNNLPRFGPYFSARHHTPGAPGSTSMVRIATKCRDSSATMR